MKPKVLITGITGFVGSWLAEYIIENELGEVYGTKRWRSPMDNIKHLDIPIYDCDLKDVGSVIRVLKRVKPDRIYHLAAQSYVKSSFEYPMETMQDNAGGTLNLLESILLTGQNPFIHICSSSEVYGDVGEDEIPIKETHPFRPASPYADSKVLEDMYGYTYWLAHGLDIVRTRMFTHTGPRRGEVFCESTFAKQIAEIEVGKRDHISVGNLESIRTWLDVRDAVKAYWKLAECHAGEVYNIGGDHTCTVGEMLRALMDFSTVDRFDIVVDEARLRPADVTRQIPDVSKFKKAVEWEPEIGFDFTMRDLLQYWRERV